MYRLFLGTALMTAAFFTTLPVDGDDKKPDDPPKAKGTLPPNWKQIGLNRDQVQKVYDTQAKYNTEIDKLKAKIEALKAEEKVELEKILTDDQKKKLREIRTGEKDKPTDKPDKDKPTDKPKDKPTDKPTDKPKDK